MSRFTCCAYRCTWTHTHAHFVILCIHLGNHIYRKLMLCKFFNFFFPFHNSNPQPRSCCGVILVQLQGTSNDCSWSHAVPLESWGSVLQKPLKTITELGLFITLLATQNSLAQKCLVYSTFTSTYQSEITS